MDDRRRQMELETLEASLRQRPYLAVVTIVIGMCVILGSVSLFCQRWTWLVEDISEYQLSAFKVGVFLGGSAALGVAFGTVSIIYGLWLTFGRRTERLLLAEWNSDGADERNPIKSANYS